MNLTYEAVDASGLAQADTIQAADVREAAELLRGRGLYVTHIAPEQQPAGQRDRRPATKADASRLPIKTLALFTRQMAMLLKAGSAVVPAVLAIKRQMRHAKHRVILGQIVSDLEDGVPLGDALRRWRRTFDPAYCAIIAAGEASGALPEMFDRLAGITSARRAMRSKIIGALTYPALLASMSVGILLVLLLFVLPRFSDMFTQLGVEPPWITQVLLNVGALIQGHWLLILLASLCVVGLIVAAAVSDIGRRWLSDMQLAVPGFGRVRARLIQGQVFRTMGTLLNSRVGLLDTLELVRETTASERFHRMFDSLEETVTSGGQPSSAFEASGLIEPYICQAVRTGEESGNLGGAITYCAEILDESNAELIHTVTRLLEPAILIVMGALVGGVAVALFLPLFEMTSAIQ